MAAFIPSSTILLAASVQSRQRMRAANSNTYEKNNRKTWKEINEERQKRESMLTPEELALFKQALADFERDPGYPEGMKDGESRARFCLREKDALIGAFLGSDLREYPDYQSNRYPTQEDKSGIKRR